MGQLCQLSPDPEATDDSRYYFLSSAEREGGFFFVAVFNSGAVVSINKVDCTQPRH